LLDNNSKSFYVTDESGDIVMVEITEHHGMMNIAVGTNFNISISPDDAFDIVDAMTMVANDISSHVGEE
jgi:hypothetical protein